MTEQITVNGKDIWVMIEPHALQATGDEAPSEYFTASYYLQEPSNSPGGVLFLDEDKTAKRFESPVEALEYVNEKLLGLL